MVPELEAGMAGKTDRAGADGAGGTASGHDRGIGGARSGQGWLDGLLGPVYYARNRDGYRPPPVLFCRLSRRLGPTAASLGLAPKDVITLEVPGRRSGVIRRTTLVRVVWDGGALTGTSSAMGLMASRRRGSAADVRAAPARSPRGLSAVTRVRSG